MINLNSRYHLLKVLLISMVCVFTTISDAQIKLDARYEREQKNSDPEFIVISMEENGIALVRNTDKYQDGKQLWEVIALDTDLKETWSLQMDIESRLRLVGYEYNNDWIYILYRISEHEASDLNLFAIHRINQEIKRYSIKQEVSFKITHLDVLQNVIVLGGYVNSEPAILIHDLATENLKIVPGFFASNSELLDLRANVNNTFNALILDQKNKLQKRLILKTFDSTGALLLENIVELDLDRTILSGMTSTLINDDLFITGTWTTGNTSRSATGIYSVLADPFNKQTIKYYDYGQLANFLTYQSPKKAAKLKQRSMEAKAAGTIPEFKAYSSIMRLDEKPEGYALLTEVYQPTSSINTNDLWDYYYPNYYGGYSPYGYNPFSTRYYNRPYQYNNSSVQAGETKILNAAVILFDKNGDLVSDYSMTLRDKKSNGVEQTSDFLVNNGNVTMAYKKEKEVLFMRGNIDGQIQSDTLTLSIDNPEEIIRTDTEDSFVRHWYTNHMFIWGYQRIKIFSKDSDASHRDVFYINKISVD